jgi:hypothetical protein
MKHGAGKILAHSFGSRYIYALGDATELYNSESSSDIVRASRSIFSHQTAAAAARAGLYQALQC